MTDTGNNNPEGHLSQESNPTGRSGNPEILHRYHTRAAIESGDRAWLASSPQRTDTQDTPIHTEVPPEGGANATTSAPLDTSSHLNDPEVSGVGEGQGNQGTRQRNYLRILGRMEDRVGNWWADSLLGTGAMLAAAWTEEKLGRIWLSKSRYQERYQQRDGLKVDAKRKPREVQYKKLMKNIAKELNILPPPSKEEWGFFVVESFDRLVEREKLNNADKYILGDIMAYGATKHVNDKQRKSKRYKELATVALRDLRDWRVIKNIAEELNILEPPSEEELESFMSGSFDRIVKRENLNPSEVTMLSDISTSRATKDVTDEQRKSKRYKELATIALRDFRDWRDQNSSRDPGSSSQLLVDQG